MSTKPHNSLVGHFLIAMPSLHDSYFANTVIYIWRHTEEGALGLVVNLPIRMQLSEVFEQLGMEERRASGANQIVLSGGPVETEKGFVLHDSPPDWPSSLAITDEITITTSRDILADIARDAGPRNYLVALGCSGWSPGQLEQELRDNSWLTARASKDVIFSHDFAGKPDMATAPLGFTLSQLTPDVGYS
ncbi:MAG: YqgE/AlgH family protein [Gammaproteobacteria bacterium]